MTDKAFWRHKPLSKMTPAEWESLCDGCARCCLYKLEDADTGEISYTCVACWLLDIEASRCMNYRDRKMVKEDCLVLNAEDAGIFDWLPKTCAYRRLHEGKDLPDWHPLVSGDPDSVHKAGISLRDKAISEVYVDPADFERYTIDIDV